MSKAQEVIDLLVNEAMSASEFLKWHDQKGGPPTKTLDAVYKIFKTHGAATQDDVDVSYNELPQKAKEEVTKLVKGR